MLRVGKAEPLAGGAAGVDVEQFGGNVAYLLGGLAARFLPLVRTKAMQWRAAVVAAGVARNQVQVGDRNVQLGFVRVLQYQKLGLLILNCQVGQAKVAPDTVIDMDHGGAFAQLGQVANDRVAKVGGLAAAAALHHALAEQLALGDQRHAGAVDLHALIQRCDGDRYRGVAGGELGPAVDGCGLELNACQQLGQCFAPTCRFSDKQSAPRVLLQKALQRRQRVFQLVVDSQFRGCRAVEDISLGLVGAVLVADDARLALELGKNVLNRQKQLGWRQQRASRVHALFAVAGAYVLPEVFGALLDPRQREQAGVVRQVIEQAGQLIKEQRQVVFDAGGHQAFAQILIQRAAAVVDLKALAKARAKTGQGRLVERKLLGWQQVNAVNLVDRALALGVEGAQGFDFLIEQVDAVRQAAAHWVQVEQGAAYGVVAVLIHGIYAAVAGGVQVQAHLVDIQSLADFHQQHRAAEEGAGRQAVQDGGHRYDENALFDAWQLEQGFQALGNDVLMRREAIVGQGFPVGEADDRQLRGKEAQFLLEAVGRGAVRGDDQAQARVLLGPFGDRQRPGRAL